MDDTVAKLQSAYDSASYPFWFYPQTQLDRIAATAMLAGVAPPNPEKSRVLEIGCGSGGNLLPMAEQFPQSQFLGIDLSPRQIEWGKIFLGEIRLDNIQLQCQDILDFPRDVGKFDYIIAHGVYSWVPLTVREKLLAICRDHLSPTGLAFVSFNTYPGWRLKEPARELMLYHNRAGGDAAHIVARSRQIVQMMAEHSLEKDCYGEMLRLNHEFVQHFVDNYLLHDHLETVNEPCYFWQFAQAMKAHGLSYLGDSNMDYDSWIRLSQTAREAVFKMASDPLDQEQYLDFLVGQAFRCAVLCLDSTETAATPAVDLMGGMYVAGNFSEEPANPDPQGNPVFKFKAGKQQLLISDHRALAILRHIRAAWPMPVPFSDLLKTYRAQLKPPLDERRLTKDLDLVIRFYFGYRMIELMTRPSSVIAASPNEFPRASRYARWAAARNLTIPTLRLTAPNVDASLRELIVWLDGARDREAIADEIIRSGSAAWSHKNRKELDALIEIALGKLAEMQFLMNPI
jgi:SAM-dependent methyltransferase/methyltransferase-like protein